ncbi:MAG: hypothetical protein ACE5HB_01340 [Terriglobia bacterium]
MSVVVLSREEWGADPAHPRLGKAVPPAERTEVFIHHTVVVDEDVSPNEWETVDEVKAKMRQLQTIRPDLGLDVPYSMVAFCMADGDLVLGEGRGLERSGAHTRGHNRKALGIAFQGNFERTPLPGHFEQQLVDLGDWLRELRTEKGLVNLGTVRPVDREVWGHRDVKDTLCPGRHLFERLALIRFVEEAVWQQPGDPIRSDADERRVIASHGRLRAGEVDDSVRRPVAVLLDQMMQLDGRLKKLESTRD